MFIAASVFVWQRGNHSARMPKLLSIGKKMSWKKIRVGTYRPGISGPTRPGSDEKNNIAYLTVNKI
jgi:hypothetical protein